MIAGQVGWEFHYCKDATMAVAKALELKPTVILQDLVMPEMDGLDLVKLYREQEALKETPLIVLASLMVLLIFYLHRGNIQRILAKEETKISDVLKKKKD